MWSNVRFNVTSCGASAKGEYRLFTVDCIDRAGVCGLCRFEVAILNLYFVRLRLHCV